MTTTPTTPGRAAPPVAALPVHAPDGLMPRRGTAAGPVWGSTGPAAPRVVGLDLSLTATGLSNGARTWLIKSKGAKDASLLDRARRLSFLADSIIDATAAEQPTLVVVEGPSFGQQRQAGQHDRAGLWWLTIEGLATGAYGLHVVEVPPATLKMYATGKGNAAKDEVLAAVVRRYADVDVDDNNAADALVLAAMGLRHLGHAIDDMPLANLRAMAKVSWPEATR